MTTPNLYALLVGINEYQQVRGLNGCVNDIRAVQKFLSQRLHQKPNILLLEDKAATRDAIIDGFNNHLCTAGKGDVVLFYFCGHGARELAGAEFKDWELDNAHETIVCHDSRSQMNGKFVPDLADKELRYLISQVANRGENSPDHVLVVFDCCHSSSGTRDLEDAEGVRQLDDAAPARKYDDFYFEKHISKEKLSPETFPQGSHTLIAACLNTQTAKETPQKISETESQTRGLFTYSLIKELESQNGRLSYQHLIHAVQTRVGVRLYQTPQLEFIEGFDPKNPNKIRQQNLENLAFLGNPAILKPRDPSFTLQYRPFVRATSTDPEQQAEWFINAGAFQGIQAGMELTVYPPGSRYEDFEIQVDGAKEPVKFGSQTALKDAKTNKDITIKIIEVRATESAIAFVSGTLTPENDQQFPAIITQRPDPKILFYFEGKEAADQALLQGIKEKLQEEWKSLVVGVVGIGGASPLENRHQPHHYRLYANENQFEIRDGIDNRLLIEPFQADAHDLAIDLAATRVEHVALWTTTRDLENPNSSIDKNNIEIEIQHNNTPLTGSHYPLSYELKNGEWTEPQIRLKLKNKSNQPYFCTILEVKGDYSVEVFPVLEENGSPVDWIQLEPQQEYQATYEGEEMLTLGIPKYLIERGITKYGEALKLIVSTHPFSVDSFRLGGLDITPDRDLISRKKPPIGDWTTKQISFTYTRPNDAVAVNPNTKVELSSGISIKVPDGFSANAGLKSVSALSSERSLGSEISLPLLKDAEAFDLIDRRGSDRALTQNPAQQLSVLELSGNSLDIAKVTPESPLVISSDRPLAHNEGILALAHDGEFWLPVGYAMPQEHGRTEIEVQHLVTRVDQGEGGDSPGDGEADRKISEAISLCFLKVVMQKKETAWLRKATLNPDGSVSFTPKGDLASVQQAVSQAKHIALFVHGILGDTESMIPSMLKANLLNLNSDQELGKYDLVLAFDYESLNTRIQDTAHKLKEQLQKVGLEKGHNKTLHIIAHSMGGLVSRSFIEQQGGSEVVNHLIMLGTPNGGSEWSSVYQLATLLLSTGLSFIPQSFVAGSLVNLLAGKTTEVISRTLKQMNIQESDILPELERSPDPHCPYTIIAGDTQLNQNLSAKTNNLLKALEQKVWKGLEFPFKGQRNDIAVTVESIFSHDVFKGRDPAVQLIDPEGVPCNHLVYFQDQYGLDALARAVRQAFELPIELENQSAEKKSTESHGSPREAQIVVLNNLLNKSIQPQKTSIHQTGAKFWFDTTHVVAIGVDRYMHPVPSLNNAVNDAITVAEMFDSLGSEEKIEKHLFLGAKQDFDPVKIRELTGKDQPGEVTKESIELFLENLAKTLKNKETQTGRKSDRLVFYFAGHGIALSSQDHTDSSAEANSPDDKPRGYLLLQNANQEEPKTFLPLDSLLDKLADIPVKQCLIILDSCFAGAVKWALFKTRDLIFKKTCPSLLDLFIDSPAWQIITSADETQKANDGWKTTFTNNRGSSTNSPFVMSLKQALLGDEENCYRNAVATATELNTYLYRSLQLETASVGKRQTPEIFKIPGKHGRGEFVFLQKSFAEVGDILKEKSPDPAIDEKENPYRGLLSYSSEDEEIFFGRKRLIDQLFERVKQNKFPLTIVLGASGSGKSSLVKAGLIPKMFPKQNTAQPLHKGWEECRPGRSPATNLEQALEKLQINTSLPNEKRLLLIDQFEEVETQCQDENQKNQFWKQLIDLLKTEKVDVVLTLRSDFETTLRNRFESAFTKGNAQSKEASNYWVSVRFPVRMMEAGELEEMIEKPASIKAVLFTDKSGEEGRTLVQQLIHEVDGMPGALALLSVALQSMYQNFAQRYLKGQLRVEPEKREITWDDYKSLGGGVPGALRAKATEEFNNNLKYEFETDYTLKKDQAGKPIPVEQEVAQRRMRMFRWAMLRMLSRKGGVTVRKQALKADLVYPNNEDTLRCQEALERFASPEVRLLISDGEGAEAYYEPAHDALVREWDYIAAWLDGKEHPEQQSEGEQVGTKPLPASPNKPGLFEKLLTDFRNFILRRDASTNLQPFNLTLLEQLNVAAKEWNNPVFLNQAKEPTTTNKEEI